MNRTALALLIASVCPVVACSSSDDGKTDAQYQAETITNMHDVLLGDITDLLQASKDLQAAAPPNLAGWTDDQVNIMKAAWIRARSAYEKSEGALAPIFPDIDTSIDARYDDFLQTFQGAGNNDGDQNLFDDQGVTGLHAVERILYVKETPDYVVNFEKGLVGYKAAAWPASDAEASDFKNKLCAKIVADAQKLSDLWTPQKVDIALAFGGLVDLMKEQEEKVNKAGSNEEESRYSQRTMADLRDNLTGTETVYALFEGWLTAKSNSDPNKDGKTCDTKIKAGFTKLEQIYATVKGPDGSPSPALPKPPSTWSSENPSQTDLATPFGQLYTSVHDAVDTNVADSVGSQMNTAAAILGFKQFTP